MKNSRRLFNLLMFIEFGLLWKLPSASKVNYRGSYIRLGHLVIGWECLKCDSPIKNLYQDNPDLCSSEMIFISFNRRNRSRIEPWSKLGFFCITVDLWTACWCALLAAISSLWNSFKCWIRLNWYLKDRRQNRHFFLTIVTKLH